MQEIEHAEERGQARQNLSGGRSGIERSVRVSAIQIADLSTGGFTERVSSTAARLRLVSFVARPPGRRQGWPDAPPQGGPTEASFQVERQQVLFESPVLWLVSSCVSASICVPELFDRVFLVAELFDVALVEIAGAVELRHVLPGTRLLLVGDGLDLLLGFSSARWSTTLAQVRFSISTSRSEGGFDLGTDDPLALEEADRAVVGIGNIDLLSRNSSSTTSNVRPVLAGSTSTANR